MALIFKYRSFILYGLLMAALSFLLKWLEFKFMVLSHSLEVFMGFVAVIFTGLGIWLALKLSKPKTETRVVEKIIIEKESDYIFNQSMAEKLGLSERELEVLELMAQGLSNKEISEKLFISLNTTKTHSSNLFDKLDVERRTAAVQKARELRLIP